MRANEVSSGATAFSHRKGRTNDFKPTATKPPVGAPSPARIAPRPLRSGDRSYRSRAWRAPTGVRSSLAKSPVGARHARE